MTDLRLVENDVSSATVELGEEDNDLVEWAAELEHRIELLEGDVALLCKAVGLAGMREQELLTKLGLSDETLQRHNSEVLAEAAIPLQQRR